MATWVQSKPDLRPRLSARWLITPSVDLGLVIGGSLAGYLYLFLNLILHVPISFLWWFWSIGFDGTHIFGTATRTYFDAQARRRNRVLFFGSLAFFFSLGPAMVLAGWKPALVLIVVRPGIRLFAGFGLTHYYLDSKIWRVRHDPGLRAALRL